MLPRGTVPGAGLGAGLCRDGEGGLQPGRLLRVEMLYVYLIPSRSCLQD